MTTAAPVRAFLACLILMFTSSALANLDVYDLKLRLSVDGRHVSSPRVIVGAGDTATVRQKTGEEESFIEVVASDLGNDKNNEILMKFVVGKIGKDGQKTIVAKPQIITRENTLARVTVATEEDQSSQLLLAVVATRRNLLEGL